MNVYKNIIKKNTKIAVIGLGYVGLPLAIAFDEVVDVIGFDVDIEKIKKYNLGIDVTNEVGNEKIKDNNIKFTFNKEELKKANFYIITVPTPINKDDTPDLSFIKQASKLVGESLSKDSIVIYESTVYPGVTEGVCLQILEKYSSLKCGKDFKIGYSPERINPSDKIHTLKNITKVVSGIDEESLDEISKVYQLILKNKVFKASSIKVAEACKVIENTQRDINIAFANEISKICNLMNIDTKEVLKAMNTKWNSLNFKPGLVGGHCIGIDPYYLIYKAKEYGYYTNIISNARLINESMSKYITDNIIKLLMKNKKILSECKVLFMGVSFKENCKDLRNSKMIDVINNLKEYEADILVYDNIVDGKEAKKYGIDLINLKNINNVDVIVIGSAHDNIKKIKKEDIFKLYKDNKKILIDINNSFYDYKDGFIYFGL